jgi:hypothetical protein
VRVFFSWKIYPEKNQLFFYSFFLLSLFPTKPNSKLTTTNMSAVAISAVIDVKTLTEGKIVKTTYITTADSWPCFYDKIRLFGGHDQHNTSNGSVVTGLDEPILSQRDVEKKVKRARDKMAKPKQRIEHKSDSDADEDEPVRTAKRGRPAKSVVSESTLKRRKTSKGKPYTPVSELSEEEREKVRERGRQMYKRQQEKLREIKEQAAQVAKLTAERDVAMRIAENAKTNGNKDAELAALVTANESEKALAELAE